MNVHCHCKESLSLMTAGTLSIVISSPAMKLSGRVFVDGTFLGALSLLSTSAKGMQYPFCLCLDSKLMIHCLVQAMMMNGPPWVCRCGCQWRLCLCQLSIHPSLGWKEWITCLVECLTIVPVWVNCHSFEGKEKLCWSFISHVKSPCRQWQRWLCQQSLPVIAATSKV